METCRACGARVLPDSTWCQQCTTPTSGSPPVPLVAEVVEAPPVPAARPQPVEYGQDPEVEFSRIRPGPTSMGVVGRTAISALTLLAAFVLYRFAMPFFLLQLFGTPGLLLYLTVAGPVVVYLLWRIWRPARIR